jgi:hypothetical protein
MPMSIRLASFRSSMRPSQTRRHVVRCGSLGERERGALATQPSPGGDLSALRPRLATGLPLSTGSSLPRRPVMPHGPCRPSGRVRRTGSLSTQVVAGEDIDTWRLGPMGAAFERRAVAVRTRRRAVGSNDGCRAAGPVLRMRVEARQAIAPCGTWRLKESRARFTRVARSTRRSEPIGASRAVPGRLRRSPRWRIRQVALALVDPYVVDVERGHWRCGGVRRPIS